MLENQLFSIVLQINEYSAKINYLQHWERVFEKCGFHIIQSQMREMMFLQIILPEKKFFYPIRLDLFEISHLNL